MLLVVEAVSRSSLASSLCLAVVSIQGSWNFCTFGGGVSFQQAIHKVLVNAGDAIGRSNPDGGAEGQVRNAAASICDPRRCPAAASAGHGNGQ